MRLRARRGDAPALDRFVPHAHARLQERGHAATTDPRATHRAILLLSALTIHNLPEGLAVGLAFAAGGHELGVPLALAIGIQNVPEGFAAGAMLYIVADELIPESHSAGHEREATVALLAGFALMLALERARLNVPGSSLRSRLAEPSPGSSSRPTRCPQPCSTSRASSRFARSSSRC